jgi:hypothetical protein
VFRKILIPKARESEEARRFFKYVIEKCTGVALEVGRERMFLSGKNKVKLQIWQFLLAFDPQTVFFCLGEEGFQLFLINLIEALSLNGISEIRYYSELFLMKLLLEQELFCQISRQLLKTLKAGLGATGNVNKNVSYIITSGILIRHILSMS